MSRNYLNCVVQLPLDVLLVPGVIDNLVTAFEQTVTAGNDAEQTSVHGLKSSLSLSAKQIVISSFSGFVSASFHHFILWP